MKFLLVIGVYAALSKELGLPPRFPGTRPAYEVRYQTTDAQLLARATVWAGSTQTAGVKYLMSPTVISSVGRNYGRVSPRTLAWTMRFDQLVGWGVGDFLFHHEANNITSPVKIRQAGFADALDTETRLLELFDQLVERKLLPPMR